MRRVDRDRLRRVLVRVGELLLHQPHGGEVRVENASELEVRLVQLARLEGRITHALLLVHRLQVLEQHVRVVVIDCVAPAARAWS